MTQDEIIELAKQAGLHFYEFGWTSPTKENLYPENVSEEALEAFAKLVAAKEREACAIIVDEFGDEWMCDAHMLSKIIRARGEE